MTTQGNPNFIQRLILMRRKDLGLTQAELAERIGIRSPEMIALIERGNRQIDLDRAPRCADALMIDRVAFCKLLFAQKYPEAFQVLFPGEDPQSQLTESQGEVDQRAAERDLLIGRFAILPQEARTSVLTFMDQVSTPGVR